MIFRGFWEKLAKPIIGLAPMDGVTDAAFRYIVCRHSRPSVVFTEFTNVEGMARGATKMLVSFLYNEIERPVVGQLFGVELESYYKCSVMLCALGFDGIDINMGCPVTKVARKGSGAALIKKPDLAREIIRACKRGVKDWSEGISLAAAGVKSDTIVEIERMLTSHGRKLAEMPRGLVPVSVKTRIGFDEIVAEEWVKILLEEGVANITMHGRTLKQMYMGRANWEVLARAARVVHESGLGVTFLGNGDVSSREDALAKIKEYGVDGVLIGRAALGNPWVFNGRDVNLQEKFDVLMEHSRYFSRLALAGSRHGFVSIRKHLGWYCKGFDGAKECRMKLMQVEGPEEVERILESIRRLS